MSLLGRVSGRAFRSFVDDMLELLLRYDGAGLISIMQCDRGSATISTQQLVAVIQDFICNAVPSSTAELRRRRYARSFELMGSADQRSFLNWTANR